MRTLKVVLHEQEKPNSFPDCVAIVERAGALRVIETVLSVPGYLAYPPTVALYAPGTWLRCYYEEGE